MTPELSNFAARLRGFIHSFSTRADVSSLASAGPSGFSALALELFVLQFTHNAAYRKICEARRATPSTMSHWTQIPAVPAAAFKEFDVTCLPSGERKFVFHSSGTTAQQLSRHYHNAESFAVYEASLLPWFRFHHDTDARLVVLTPTASAAPHSSLVHMFDVIRRDRGLPESIFHGRTAADGSWAIDFETVIRELQAASDRGEPLALLGTAFSFVHLLDHLAKKNLRFRLPPDSRVLETGGYKGRSRSLPKAELHQLISTQLGVPDSRILCEYGMSELSSQAYDGEATVERPVPRPADSDAQHQTFTHVRKSLVLRVTARAFRFPPWARSQIICAETGREVADGKTGLLRIFDLANVFSVLAIQTEDLAIRRDEHFELIGRAALAEPRGCSLMAV